MKEIRLFPAPRDFEPSALKETQASDDAASSKKGKGGGSKYPLRRCYLDVKSGYVDFRDDSWADKSGVRTLYYSDYVRNERPDVYTFASCPRCRSGFGRGDVSTFSARGDASFFNVIGSQFHSQPSVPGKERLPNEGRKVLLFSDSRQRAAKLARDMSTTADLSAARQLFALAVKMMEEQKEVQPLQNLYGFVAYWAAKNKKIPFLRDKETAKLYDELLSDEDEAKDWGDEFVPEKKMDAAPPKMQEYALRLFCGARNTLYDTATLWLEPTKKRAKSALKLHPRSYGTSLKCLHKDLIQTNLGCDFIADMLVLEIGLPPGVDASSSWTKRAARTLAEALRKTFCKILDLDFDELVAGYRVRERQDVVDVYLYDSLSSGAGYATGLAETIGAALFETEKALDGCRCSSACVDCLKHYRNRFYHGSLDRFEALALLRWGTSATLPEPLSIDQQFAALLPLKRMLKNNGSR